MGQEPVPVAAAVVVYADGACSPNPGPGGWAWAVPPGRYASGASARTTNQRMEVMAAMNELVDQLAGEAARTQQGRRGVVSDRIGPE